MSDIQETIRQQISTNPVVLYMKGTPQFPQCGYSASAVQMVQRCGVKNFFAVNVLPDPALVAGLREFANWPTLPQFWVKGEFIGGHDIMKEMFTAGELQQLLAEFAEPASV